LVTGTLPSTYGVNQEKSYPLLIHLVGSPDLSGSLTFTFADNSIIIPITGDRLVQYPFKAFKSMNIKHSFSTNKAETLYKQQDRQKMNDREGRTITFDYFAEDMDLDTLFGYAQDKVMAIPIVTETMQSTNPGSLQGVSQITVSNDITTFFELKLSKYLSLIQDNMVEVVEIDSVDTTNKTITLKTSIINDFDPVRVKITPAALCWTVSYNAAQKRNYKDNLYNITLKEAVING